jgi:hypothetical protein
MMGQRMSKLLIVLMAVLMPGIAKGCEADACATMDINLGLVYKCPTGEYLARDECDTMTYEECCTAYGFSQIEPAAGMEAQALEPIDYQSEWLEQGQNLE